MHKLFKKFSIIAVLICLGASSLKADVVWKPGPEYDPKGVALVERIKENITPILVNPWEGADYSRYHGLKWSDDQPRVLKAINLPPDNCIWRGKLEISNLPGLESITIRHIDELNFDESPYADHIDETTDLSKIGERYKDLTIANLPDLRSLNIGWKLDRARTMNLKNLETLPNLRELNLDHGLYERADWLYLKSLKKLETLSLNESTFDDLSVLSELPGLKSVSIAGKGLEKVVTPPKKGSKYSRVSFQRRQTPLKIEGLKSSSLTNLNLCNKRLDKIEGLTELLTLETLDLSGTGISRIDGLDSLTRLKELNLAENNLEKMEGLTKLTRLEILNLSDNPIAQIEGLENLRSLKSLYLPPVQKLDGLENLAELEDLTLSYVSIPRTNNDGKYKDFAVLNSLAGLEQLKDLKSLEIKSADINDLKEISSLKNLRYLTVSSSRLASLEGLESLGGLTRLKLSHNRFSDLSYLKNLKFLLDLDISGSGRIIDLSALSSLTQLQNLNLRGRNLTDITVLNGLNNLTNLNLDFNKISDLKHLKGLGSLEILSLSNNPITDLTGLAEAASQLQVLDLSTTKITDLTPLSGLEHLRKVNCHYTALQGPLNMPAWPALEELDLTDNKISDINGYQSIPPTASIIINKNNLPLSIIYKFMQDKQETGRNWLIWAGQDNVGGNKKLHKGDVLDFGRELEIGGQTTRFEVWDVSNKGRPFPLHRQDFLVGQEEDGRFIFKHRGNFIIRMTNEAVFTLMMKHTFLGALPSHREPTALKVISGEITVD